MKRTISIERALASKLVEYVLPSLPNFIRDRDDNPVDIVYFTKEELKLIGQQWAEALIEHAEKRAERRFT